MKEATCVYLVKDGYVQMAEQTSIIVGLKGYGGKITQEQTPRSNAVEEVWQETGGVPELRIHPEQDGGIHIREEWLHPVGLIDFYNGTEEEAPFGDPTFRVYFFLCFQWKGVAIDTIEMKDHQLFNINCLPFERMVHGDAYIIPRMLQNIPLEGYFRRSADFTTVITNAVYECTNKSLSF